MNKRSPARSPLLRGVMLFAAAVLALVVTGCTTYSFKVDALKNPDAIQTTGASYRITSANPEIDAESLEMRRASEYVKTALSSKGMYEAPEGVPVDVVIEVDFGMDPPRQEVRTWLEPVYRTVPGAVHVVTYTVTDPDGRTRVVREVIRDPPQQVFVGMREVREVITLYPKYLRITARETPEQAGERPPREQWSVYVTNEDEADDLDEYVPLMVSAAMDSIDQNSTSTKKVVLSDKDERVLFVKKGL